MTKLKNDIARLPFAFWLEDREEHSVIYIVDPDKRTEQRLNLFIENSSEQTLFFSATNLEKDPPSRTNCHFELCFRRGVLDPASLGTSTLKPLLGKTMELLLTGKYEKRAYEIGSWVISEPDDHGGKEPYVSFYLARSEKGSGGRFLPGERFRLVLTNISANPDEGSSETRVELVPRNIFYDPPNQAGARPVDEPREQTARIVNHTGKEHIPLHLDFVGSYTVRNDGQAQGEGHLLRLRITNTSRHDAIVFNEKSRLHFTFDFAEGDQEEELGIAGDVAKIKFYLKEKYSTASDQDWRNLAGDSNKIKAYLDKYCTALSSHSQMVQNPVWELCKDQKLPTLSLEPGQHWDILIDARDFVTHSPAGLTPLHLSYEGIPGYWDGKLHTAVEKTPLLVRTAGAQNAEVVELDTGQRPVHIIGEPGGAGDRQEKVRIAGHLKLLQGKAGQLGATLTLTNPTGGQGAGAAIDFNGYEVGNNNPTLRLQSLDDGNYSSHFIILSKKKGAGTNALVERLRITSEGKVGIGTDAPEEPLHVVGKTILTGDLNVGGNGAAKIITRHVEGKSYASSDADALYLNYYTGKDVHVGEKSRPSSLHVTGRIKDKTGDLMPVGSIIAYGGDSIPDGWLECNGQKINDSKYADLRAALGNRYTVPDLRCRFIVGVGTNSDHYKYGLNDKGGDERITLSISEMPSHTHDVYYYNDIFHTGDHWTDSNFKNRHGDKHPKQTTPSGSAGGNNPHNNLPPYYALRYIIKY